MRRFTEKYVGGEINKERCTKFDTIEEAIEFVDNDNHLCYNIRTDSDGYMLIYKQTINHPRFDRVKNKDRFLDHSKFGGVECPWSFLNK